VVRSNRGGGVSVDLGRSNLVCLFLSIINTIMFTLQLQQECSHMVRSNEVVRGILGAIADSLPAAEFE